MATMRTGVLYDVVARDRASKTFDKVGASASRLEKTTASAGKAIAKGLAIGSAAVVGIGAVSVKSAVDFQSSMTRISTQAGGTTKDVKVLSDQVLKLGGKVQQAPQELADSLYHLKSVGMDNADAMKALRQASDLAAVGHANLEETTNALAGAWRTGIKGAGSFHQAVSTVNAIIGAGNMSMEQFNEAIGSGILPSAKAFGLSLNQVGAALALMTDEGIPAADAATRLRMSFSLLGAPSQAAEKQLKKIGLTGLQLGQAMRGKDGIIGAIQLLKDHLDASGLSAAQQSQILSRAFGGGRSSSGILTLINNLDVLKKKQDQVNKSTGRFDDAVKQQRKTAEAEWKRLTTGLESTSVRLGTVLLPPLTGFVGFLNDKALPAASRFSRTVASLIPVGQIKKAIGDVKTEVGGFLSGLRGISPKAPKSPLDKFPTTVLYPLGGSPHLGSAQTSSKGGKGLQLMPHYGVGQTAPTTGVQGPALASQPHGGSGLAAPLVKLPKAAPKSAAQQLGETIRKAISGGIENIDWGKLGSKLGAGLGTAVQWVGKHGAELTKKLGEALGSLDWVDIGKQFGKVALPTAIGFVNNLFEPLFHKEFWKKHWLDAILFVVSALPFGKVFGKVGSLFVKGFGKLGGLFMKIPWGKIIPFGAKLAEAAGPILRDIGSFAVRTAVRLGEAFVRRFPRVAGWIVREIGLLPTRLGVIGIKLAEKGATLVSKLGSGLINHIPGMGNRFIRFTLKTFGKFTLYQTGLNLAKSLTSGAWAKLKDIGSWMKHHLVDPVINWVKSGFGIASPSKVFTSIGHNLILGFRNGIWGLAKGIGGWVVSHVVTPVTSRFSRAGSWLWSKGSALVGGLEDGIASKAKSITGWTTSHVISPVTGTFSKARSWLYGKGKDILYGLWDGLVFVWKKLTGWVSGIAGWIKDHKGPISLDRKLLTPAGKALMSGLLTGLKIGFGDVGDFVYSVGDTVKGTVGKIAGSIGSTVGLGKSSDITKALQFAQLYMRSKYGWSGPQWSALKSLWTGESGWRWWAKNPSSGAFGIPQALPAGKMASAGSDWRTNAATQIKWGLSYIKSVYGNPINAYSQWMARSPHWYAKGIDAAAPGWAWVGERGPELVRFSGGEKVYDTGTSIAAAVAHSMSRSHAAAARAVPTATGGARSTRAEAALTRLVQLLEQSTASQGGEFTGQLVLDSGELMGVIKGTVQPMIRDSASQQAYRARVGRR